MWINYYLPTGNATPPHFQTRLSSPRIITKNAYRNHSLPYRRSHHGQYLHRWKTPQKRVRLQKILPNGRSGFRRVHPLLPLQEKPRKHDRHHPVFSRILEIYAH